MSGRCLWKGPREDGENAETARYCPREFSNMEGLKIRGQKHFMELSISKYLDAKHSKELVDPERVRAVYKAKTEKVRAVIVNENFSNGFTLAKDHSFEEWKYDHSLGRWVCETKDTLSETFHRRRSVSGYIFTLAEGPISWKSRKQMSL
jgi:hypothetical protein